MWFWWLMLVCDLFIPLVMVVFGIIMLKRPPKNINNFYGYRTARSMKNIETWKFAHRICGKLWLALGIASVFPSIIVPCLFYGDTVKAVGITSVIICAVQIAMLILSVIICELMLIKNFTDDGIRKQNPQS